MLHLASAFYIVSLHLDPLDKQTYGWLLANCYLRSTLQSPPWMENDLGDLLARGLSPDPAEALDRY